MNVPLLFGRRRPVSEMASHAGTETELDVKPIGRSPLDAYAGTGTELDIKPPV